MKIGIPQIIIIAMYGLNVGVNLTRDGEPRDEKYSFVTSVFATLINVFLLWAGGFFG